MMIDTRSFPYSYSTTLILEPLESIGTGPSGDPAYAYYETPALKIIRTTKVLWSSESEAASVGKTGAKNLFAYTGNMVITGATISDNIIYIGGRPYWSGTIQHTTFPRLGSYQTMYTSIETKGLRVGGYLANGSPIYVGQHVKGTKTENYTSSSGSGRVSDGSSGGGIVKITERDRKWINGKLYATYSKETQYL